MSKIFHSFVLRDSGSFIIIVYCPQFLISVSIFFWTRVEKKINRLYRFKNPARKWLQGLWEMRIVRQNTHNLFIYISSFFGRLLCVSSLLINRIFLIVIVISHVAVSSINISKEVYVRKEFLDFQIFKRENE